MTLIDSLKRAAAASAKPVQLPQPEHPLRLFRPTYTEIEWSRAVEAVIQQGMHAVAWCIRRADQYAEGPGRSWPQPVLDFAAAIDWLRQQGKKT
jgi:hypothetical protein